MSETIELNKYLSNKKYLELIDSNKILSIDYPEYNYSTNSVEIKNEKILVKKILENYFVSNSENNYRINPELIEKHLGYLLDHIQTTIIDKLLKIKASYYLLSKKSIKKEKEIIVKNLQSSNLIKYYSDNSFNETVLKNEYLQHQLREETTVKQIYLIDIFKLSSAINLTEKSNLIYDIMNFEINRIKYCLLDPNYNNEKNNIGNISNEFNFSKTQNKELNNSIAPDNKAIDKTPLLDYSNTKGTEKIIYLKELGILDYLIEKHPQLSVNGLANLLSAITGENTTTLQPYLNPIINSENDQRKNPYNSVKTVSKVKNKLIDLSIINLNK
tara:strand:+ start:44 stop:1030 length:987 start_codon:yes stop_codon:yes gene_type:complete